MLLTKVINYTDQEVYSFIENDLKKASIVIEFLSLITWCEIPLFIEERKENFNILTNMLEKYYRKYETDLIIKVKNKKFLIDLHKKITTNKFKNKVCEDDKYIYEIPDFNN